MDKEREEVFDNFVTELPDISLDSLLSESPDPFDEELVLSNLSSDDPAVVEKALTEICQVLKKQDKTFDESVYQQFVDLSMCDTESIFTGACEVLRLCISFKDAETETSEWSVSLLEMGIIDVIMARFPMEPIWGVIGNLCLSGEEGRHAIYECGILDAIPDAIEGRDKSLDEKIAIMCQGLVHDYENEDFSYEPFIPVLTAIFTNLMTVFMETETAHSAVVCAFRDLVDAHPAFVEWFIENNGLQVMMKSTCKDEQGEFRERMLRLMEVLCERGYCDYVYECGALDWLDEVRYFQVQEVQESMYWFMTAMIRKSDEGFCSDDFYDNGFVKEAKEQFEGDKTTIKVKKAVVMFLAAVFSNASEKCVCDMHSDGIFEMLIDHFDMIDDIDYVYDIVTKIDVLRGKSETDFDTALDYVRQNDDLYAWLSELEESQQSEVAWLLREVVDYDRHAEFFD